MIKNLSNPLFSGSNNLDLDTFCKSFFNEATCTAYGWGPLQTYPAHVEILHQDTPSNAVYFIHEGLVKLTWIDQDGHEVIAGIRRRFWIIGAPSVLLEKPYSFTISTLTQCAFRCISAKKFIHLVKNHTEFSFHVLRLLSQEIFNHARKLVMLGCIPSRDRLKNLLCQFISHMHLKKELQKQIKIELPLTHKELAQMIAVTPEHLSRLLNDLEKKGFMKREKNSLILLDPANLLKSSTR